MSRPYDYRVVNPILRFHWAGWTASSMSLQNAGWQLAVEEEIYNGSIRVAMRHPQHVVRGITEFMPEDAYRELNASRRHLGVIPRGPQLNTQLANALQLRIVETAMPDFNAIDCQPQLVEYQERTLDDFKMFPPVSYNVDQILLEEASMAQIIEAALSKQSPKQEQIRKRMLEEEKLQAAGQNSVCKPFAQPKAMLRLIA